MCFNVVIIGSDRPALKYLHRYVRNEVLDRWHDLGLELLEPEDKMTLDQIQHDYDKDLCERCTTMFELWLRKYPHATWHQLIQALREVGLEHVALKIDGMLTTTTGGRYLTNLRFYGVLET